MHSCTHDSSTIYQKHAKTNALTVVCITVSHAADPFLPRLRNIQKFHLIFLRISSPFFQGPDDFFRQLVFQASPSKFEFVGTLIGVGAVVWSWFHLYQRDDRISTPAFQQIQIDAQVSLALPRAGANGLSSKAPNRLSKPQIGGEHG